jgi:phage shock protein PspC (stress-responsive transcriptional regulator)
VQQPGPASEPPRPEPKRLQRSASDKLLLGVCGGLAEYFDADPALVRVLFALGVLLAGGGILLYAALALIMPSEQMADAHPRDAARATLDEAQTELRRGADQLKDWVNGMLGRR